jgi:hypothetical protein
MIRQTDPNSFETLVPMIGTELDEIALELLVSRDSY